MISSVKSDLLSKEMVVFLQMPAAEKLNIKVAGKLNRFPSALKENSQLVVCPIFHKMARKAF